MPPKSSELTRWPLQRDAEVVFQAEVAGRLQLSSGVEAVGGVLNGGDPAVRTGDGVLESVLKFEAFGEIDDGFRVVEQLRVTAAGDTIECTVEPDGSIVWVESYTLRVVRRKPDRLAIRRT